MGLCLLVARNRLRRSPRQDIVCLSYRVHLISDFDCMTVAVLVSILSQEIYLDSLVFDQMTGLSIYLQPVSSKFGGRILNF